MSKIDSCINSKLIKTILAFALLFALVIMIICSVLNPPQLDGIQAELIGAGGGIIPDGDNVIFDNVLNDQSDNITYIPVTGEFLITAPGNYLVSWWVSPDGAGPATTVSFALAVDGVPYSVVSSPIVSVQMAASALVTVDTAPVAISLVNVTGDDVFVPLTPVQAGIVIIDLAP